MEKTTWKVGELAKRTGITIRTLHHYHEVGLLPPSHHSEAGHRLYTQSDIQKLQQIVSLKQLGFSLDEIKMFLQNPAYDPTAVIRLQVDRLSQQIKIQTDLHTRLQELHDLMQTRQLVSAEQFLQIIEVMKMAEQYFTPEQLESMKRNAEQVSPEQKREIESQWAKLLTEIRAVMEQGVTPADPQALELAKRWKEMTDVFTGGDQGITQAAERFYAANPDNALQNGVDSSLYLFIRETLAKHGS